MKKIIIHELQYQCALYDPLKSTKGMRLREIQPFIESGNITFDPDIDKQFIADVVKFPGVEHDDMIDAFTSLIIKTAS